MLYFFVMAKLTIAVLYKKDYGESSEGENYGN